MIKYSWDSLAFGIIMGILAMFACGSILPVIFVVAWCVSAPFIIALSNISIKERKAKSNRKYIEKYDRTRTVLLNGRPHLETNN